MSDLTAEEIYNFNKFHDSSSKKEQEIILNQMLDNVDKSLNEDAYILPFKDAKVVSVFIGYMNMTRHFGTIAFRPHSDNKGWDKAKKVKEQVK